MARLDNFALMDISHLVQLGAAGVNALRGPVPRNLVPLGMGMAIPQAQFVLPEDTRAGGGAHNAAHWLG